MQEDLLGRLIQQLCHLPGVGKKSAQRMAFYLLERDRQGGLDLGNSLVAAMENIGKCAQCRTFTEQEICILCRNEQRDHSQLCIVENPADLMALEYSTDYRGVYFVLHGRLSPLDGLGPAEIGMPELARRLDEDKPNEIILAISPSIEGQATAHYIQELVQKHQIIMTQIAHGVPLGGELEYLDSGTLLHAFSGRQEL